MGCSNNKEAVRIIPRAQGHIKLQKFILNVEHPENKELVAFSYHTENDEMPIMQVMNAFAFDEDKGDKLDGNFISLYNEKKGEFDYYVQRLLGVGIENEDEPVAGKMWIPYINNKREDWSQLCDCNRIVCKEDDIVWRYEPWYVRDNLTTHALVPSPNEIDTGNNSKVVSRQEKTRIHPPPINNDDEQ